jgi:hypothetical protein
MYAYLPNFPDTMRYSFTLVSTSSLPYRRPRSLPSCPINALVVVFIALEMVSSDEFWHLNEVQTRDNARLPLSEEAVEVRSDGTKGGSVLYAQMRFVECRRRFKQ